MRRINFPGSTRVGRIIARLAADQLKPVLLELGGKAPLLVFGGYKQSGNGRESGVFGLEEYLELKAVLGYRSA